MIAGRLMKLDGYGVTKPYDFEAETPVVRNYKRMGALSAATLLVGGALSLTANSKLSAADESRLQVRMAANELIIDIDNSTFSAQELNLSEAMSIFTHGNATEVHCADLIDYDKLRNLEEDRRTAGLFATDEHVPGIMEDIIILDDKTCLNFTSENLYDVATSVFYFAHEGEHAKHGDHEGLANCEAVGDFWRAAGLLGLSEQVAGQDPLAIAKAVPGEEYHTLGC